MLTLETKPGVNWSVHPCIDKVQDTIAEHYAKVGAKAVVTSAKDSRHSTHSAHGEGRGIDLRITSLFSKVPQTSGAKWWRDVLEFAATLSDALADAAVRKGIPGRFDVVLEATPAHLHVEYTEPGRVPNIRGWKAAQRIYATAEARDLMMERVA